MGKRERVWAAWFVTAIFFFYQYALRSSPAVMMPELSAAFGLSVAATASMAGLVYWGYAFFSLIAGAALDRFGAKAIIPGGALAAALGALLFGAGKLGTANLGRLLQGSGGAFAFVGAVYIASRNFPVSHAATLIGAAQMFGMAGGSAGQFLVGPLVARGMPWSQYWIAMGVAGILISIVLFLVIPPERMAHPTGGSLGSVLRSLGVVLGNPQSLLCGMIAGLLFVPTTIFDMTWGVRFLQEGHGFDYGTAVMRSAAVPMGWIIGSPLLGWISDRLGRRKPVVIGAACVMSACLAWILFGSPGVLPAYTLSLVLGVASGGAMIPYTVIKEVNPAKLSGTAAGVMNFLNLALTAVLGPVFGWLFQSKSNGEAPRLEHYQAAFLPLLIGVGLALLLTVFLKETGAKETHSARDLEAA